MVASFDYIIVGAGSAGCVLASRLSEDRDLSVLLLEAGGKDSNPLLHVPLGFGKIHEFDLYDWGYRSEPERQLNGRVIRARRGKVLGGSASVNMMGYTRGFKSDYDRWHDKGAQGWSYENVLPCFRRAETWEKGATALRGGSGPVGVEYSKAWDPLLDGWLEAARALGFDVDADLIAPEPVGFGRSQYTIRDGRRSSTATAYLAPARRRRNLAVATGALATRLLFREGRAAGVEYLWKGRSCEARARREIILSAGAFNTPQLLMLSGIGPASELRDLGIDVVADLPVGRGLQDHPMVPLLFERKTASVFRDNMRLDRAALGFARALLGRSGYFATVPSGILGFVPSSAGVTTPDIEFFFPLLPPWAHFWLPWIRPAYPDGFGVRPVLLRPKSRGRVRLRTADPRDPVAFTFDYFSDADDMARMREGVKLARRLAASTALDIHRGRELQPGPDVVSDDEIEAWIRESVLSVEHASCTCPMGEGAGSVLDARMRVRGVNGLRVVDASAMPDLVSAHINACVIMMAEKAAEMIAGRSSS